MKKFLPLICLLVASSSLWGDTSPVPVSSLPGVVGTLPTNVPPTQDELDQFFQQQKRGTFLKIDLANGATLQGMFTNYDDYYERVWVIPQGDMQGVFKGKSVRLKSIMNVEIIPQQRLVRSSTASVAETDPRYDLIKGELGTQ